MANDSSSVKKPLITAVIVPLFVMFAAFSASALSDTTEKMPRMTFDSIGSMLQDMDRENSQADMEHYTLSSGTEHNRSQSCKDEARARAQMTEEQIRATIASMEAQWMASAISEDMVEETSVSRP